MGKVIRPSGLPSPCYLEDEGTLCASNTQHHGPGGRASSASGTIRDIDVHPDSSAFAEPDHIVKHDKATPVACSQRAVCRIGADVYKPPFGTHLLVLRPSLVCSQSKMSANLTLHSSSNFCNSNEALLLAKISTPEGQRAPVDVVVVIDVSGSMGDRATLKSESGKMEDNGLTILDVTKHAVKTIIKILGSHDRLGVISFDHQAQMDLELTSMSASGQNKAVDVVEGLRTRGSTNLWGGLVAGLDLLRTTERDGRLATVLILTDGVPNVNPPNVPLGQNPTTAHYLSALREYKQKYENLSAVVNTFGFGYNLVSELLQGLAEESDGAFAFIPDSGFVGTCFVNATTNLVTPLPLLSSFHLTLS
jgi:Mg-chelatase subunit ChlD